MNTIIVYDSKTGTTAAASEAMRKAFEGHGHQCRVQSIAQASPADISQADLVCVGTWVKGLFVILQHPTDGTMQFIEQLDNLKGKKVIVFCTYKLAAGSTLRQMAEAVERKGATVVGRFKFRGSAPDSAFDAFVKKMSK
ncbi:MAG: flavodoxin domain-containing protein [Anaerolineaceae bacterium]|nr:flavodoxin domain-containing protein [Anaerolineaceae bacterium]